MQPKNLSGSIMCSFCKKGDHEVKIRQFCTVYDFNTGFYSCGNCEHKVAPELRRYYREFRLLTVEDFEHFPTTKALLILIGCNGVHIRNSRGGIETDWRVRPGYLIESAKGEWLIPFVKGVYLKNTTITTLIEIAEERAMLDTKSTYWTEFAEVAAEAIKELEGVDAYYKHCEEEELKASRSCMVASNGLTEEEVEDIMAWAATLT